MVRRSISSHDTCSLSCAIWTTSRSTCTWVPQPTSVTSLPADTITPQSLAYHDVQKIHHHHNRFTAFFPRPPGWAGARRELLDFMVQGKINRGRHRPSSWAPLHLDQPMPTCTIPPFFTGRMPFLPPNQQCQSTEGNTTTVSYYYIILLLLKDKEPFNSLLSRTIW